METGDEIGDLAADFNHMADNLERQFAELEDAARRQEDFIGSFAHENQDAPDFDDRVRRYAAQPGDEPGGAL